MIALRRRRHRMRNGLLALLVAGVLASIAFVGAFLVRGGHWYVVETPSMGTSAPVGTLLWVEPVSADDLRVGDFVTFRRPGTGETYSHRISAIGTDGAISTKGQITAPDPWTLRADDIVGRVDMRWWGIGWVIKSVPILVIGGMLVWAAIRFTRLARWRGPVAVLGAAATLCVALAVVQPLTRAVQLSATPDGAGGRATYVSTGLLPLRLAADGGREQVDLRSGEVGSVLSVNADQDGKYRATLRPHIAWWVWVLMLGACFVPAAWRTALGAGSARPVRHAAPA